MKFSLAILITFYSSKLLAQAGDLDNTFSSDGKVTTAIGSNATAFSVTVQPDGKIIAAGRSIVNGSYDFCLARYNSNGALDNTFSTDGKVTTDFNNTDESASEVTVQPDGRILVAGAIYNSGNDFALARYNSNGTLDSSFSLDGKVTTAISPADDEASSIALQSDGKIVVLGRSGTYPNYVFALARYNTDGTLDYTLDSDGIVTTSITNNDDEGNSVAIESDGKIVAVGTSYDGSDQSLALLRYNTDGSLDNSFGIGGIVTTLIGWSIQGQSVAIKPNGKIITGGYSYSGHENFALIQYNIDGSLDSSFGTYGIVTTAVVTGNDNVATSVALQPDGKIVLAGATFDSYSNSDFALARYNIDGSLDVGFGDGGKDTTSFGSNDANGFSMAIQPDGKIVVAGSMFINGVGDNFALARYLSGLNLGIINFSSLETSPLIYPNPIQRTEVFKYTLASDEVLSLGLSDFNGRVVRNFLTNATRLAGSHIEELNFGNLAPGNYLLTLANGKQQVTVKLLKQ